MINVSSLAREIAHREGKSKSVDIAQISEILKIALELLAEEKSYDVLRLLEKYE